MNDAGPQRGVWLVRKTIAVGVDGSAESLDAARYAAAMARRRRDSLTLTHGFVHPASYGALAAASLGRAQLPDPRADAQALLAAAAAAVRADFPDIEIDTVESATTGQLALIERSMTADLVVVGHRGLGGFPELLLGSVGAQVAAHAHGPVVVFRPGGTNAADAPVVVGVDGSPESTAAVEFAINEAADREVALEALNVYPEVLTGAAAGAGALLDSVLGPWTAKHPEVEVRRAIRPAATLDDTPPRRHPGPADNAEAIFVDASRRAGLVVVGSRGRGGFTGLLLGSVSQALVHHAHGPVAVVHADTSQRNRQPRGSAP